MKPFDRVYNVVKKIPAGKVMTYKSVSIVSNVKTPRIVGFALHANKTPKDIPCHRVIKNDGSFAEGYAFGGKDVQKRMLKREGVPFLTKEKVDLSKSLYAEG